MSDQLLSDLTSRVARLEEHSRYVDIWEQKQNGTLQKMSGQLEKLDEKMDIRFEKVQEKLDTALAAMIAQQAADKAELTLKINNEIRILREEDTASLRSRLNWVVGVGTTLGIGVVLALFKVFLQV